ncbi:hypothetical protein GCM10027053_47410 [Intrasporangium mesophilum]
MRAGRVEMTENVTTLVDVKPDAEPGGDAGPVEPTAAELEAARELVRQARAKGVALTGPDGLLKALTKTVIEAALDEEMSEHLGSDRGDPAGRNRANSLNGKRSKTVVTDNAGAVEVEVPRDRAGTFTLVIVGSRQRRLSDVDAVVLSLYASGLTTGEIGPHFGDVYGAWVSKDTVTRITDRVVEEMQAWWARPLEVCTRRCSSTRSWSRSAMVRVNLPAGLALPYSRLAVAAPPCWPGYHISSTARAGRRAWLRRISASSPRASCFLSGHSELAGEPDRPRPLGRLGPRFQPCRRSRAGATRRRGPRAGPGDAPSGRAWPG